MRDEGMELSREDYGKEGFQNLFLFTEKLRLEISPKFTNTSVSRHLPKLKVFFPNRNLEISAFVASEPWDEHKDYADDVSEFLTPRLNLDSYVNFLICPHFEEASRLYSRLEQTKRHLASLDLAERSIFTDVDLTIEKGIFWRPRCRGT